MKRVVHSFGAICLLIVGLLPLVLVACTSEPLRETFRDPSASIGITSRFDAARFAGTWHVRGAYPLDAQLTQVQRFVDGPAWELVARTCEPNGDCEEVGTVWQVDGGSPGAEVLADPWGAADRRAAVLWLDEGFRTAAIGDPSGQFAWVLDRAPRGGADRIKAARQVLAFSGFDLNAMEMRP
ncbi:lipocalin family protein [uncultured Tateyamaria sp.]|uniref:lipocalin family protein n=1 Tax=uncultured Tateyamaria sp. TaxID=455651 RepID=UPI0026193E23|nr:lipocalin family protein [uncultured Tateyamaria sp.]